MQVFWDGYGLGARGSGVFVHAKKLGNELKRLGVSPCLVTTHSWAEALPEFDAALLDQTALAKFYESKLIWPLRVRLSLEKKLKREGSLAILHGLSNLNLVDVMGDKSRCITVLTVHDLIPIIDPKGVSKLSALQFALGFRKALKSADRIICVSHWTANTLLDRYPFVALKVSVIPNGVDKPTLIPRKPLLGRRLKLLCVARAERYKNLELLIKLKELAGDRLEIDLVSNSSLRLNGIRVHSGLSQKDLLPLYQSADVYVHPSFYEGFCLPAAEALSSGTPVVYLSGSGIDEVAGTLASFPMSRNASPRQWLDTIEYAAHSSRSPNFIDAVYQTLNKLPSWQDAAQKLKKLYTDLYETKR